MAMTKVKGLQMWCQRRVEGYRDVGVRDMASSWKSGLAFCALIHKFRPDLIDYDSLSKENIFENNQLAFEVAERELGIPALLEAQDMVDIRVPDRLSVVTYVSQYYNYFRDSPQLGGPGVTAKQTSSSSIKRSPAVQPATGPEAKRFAPTNDKNVGKTTPKPEQTKKTSTLGDRCVICQNKVYLLERQIENGKLYHRSCFRNSELSPTAKVFKTSHGSPLEDFGSKAKVRKTEEGPSWAKSNGLLHSETSRSSGNEPKKLFPSTQKSELTSRQEPQKPDPLLERLKSRMEADKKEIEIPSYKKNRPLVLQMGSKDTDRAKDTKSSEPPTSTFNAKKLDKHEGGFLSKTSNVDESKATEVKKPGFATTKTEISKPKETQSDTKVSFPIAKTRHFGEKEVEKMDTSEPFGTKLKHVSPTATRKGLTTDKEKSKKTVELRPKTPPFGKKLFTTQDKSHPRESVTTPDSPPPLPSSQPPIKLASKFSPLEEPTPPIPSSMPPSVPPSKSTHTTITTTTTSAFKPAGKETGSKTITTTTTTKSILKTTATSAAPSKPPRLQVDLGNRSEIPMDVDEVLHRASHPIPGADPVAVLVVPAEKTPAEEKKLLGGLLTSLANVRHKKPDDVKSPTETPSDRKFPVAKSRTDIKSELILTKTKPESSVLTSSDRKFPVAKSRTNVKSELILTTTKPESSILKSKVELSGPRTKLDVGVSKTKETVLSDKKDKAPVSFVSDKSGIFQKDDHKSKLDTHLKVDKPSSKLSDLPSSKSSAISETTSKYTSKYLGSDSGVDKSKHTKPPPRPEEPPHSWKKDTALKDQKTTRNVLLQDSNVSSNKAKDSDNVPSWKKDLDKNKAEKSKLKGSDLLLDSKSKDLTSKIDSSQEIPSWKQKLGDKDKGQQKSSDLLLDSTSKPRSESADDLTPTWMRALEKRKADKARPKSADILLLGESSKTDLPERRTKKDEKTSSVMKDRPKSATILDTEPAGKLSWQMEAERRLAHNKGGFVDPEKADKSAPQKKPRTLVTHTNGEPSVTTTTKVRIPARPPKSPPPSPPSAVRQLKKISLDTSFDFKSATPAGKKPEPTSPLKTPPTRPPPPRGGNLKAVSPGRMSPAIIQRQLDDIDTKLTDLELRGRQLEDSIRSVDTTEAEDDMMIEWFKLINSKNELVRKEADLIYMSKQQELEDEQEDVDTMLRYLINLPDDKKTDAQRRREADLLAKKMTIVNQRSDIVDSIDEDRIRYEEEDQDIANILEEKGFKKTPPGKKPKKKQKEKPRKGAFVSYTNDPET